MNERVEFKIAGRHFIAIWQDSRKVWDVYRMRDGYVTRVFVTNQPSVSAAQAKVRERLIK